MHPYKFRPLRRFAVDRLPTSLRPPKSSSHDRKSTNTDDKCLTSRMFRSITRRRRLLSVVCFVGAAIALFGESSDGVLKAVSTSLRSASSVFSVSSSMLMSQQDIDEFHRTLQLSTASTEGYQCSLQQYQSKLSTGIVSAYSGANYGDNKRVAVHGNLMVVGASYGPTGRGEVTVYYKSGSDGNDDWTYEATLQASDGSEGDNFGSSVAIHLNTVVVGADFETNPAGSVYVFTRSDTGWTQKTKLVAGDGAADGRFGHALALKGDTLVVGAWSHNGPSNNAPDNGSIYIFTRGGGGDWTQRQQINNPNFATYDRFGWAVDVSDDQSTIVVGAYGDDTVASAAGKAYIFVRLDVEEFWSLEDTIVAQYIGGPNNGAVDDQLGRSVAISPDGWTVVLGAHRADHLGTDSGSAYVYKRYIYTPAPTPNPTFLSTSEESGYFPPPVSAPSYGGGGPSGFMDYGNCPALPAFSTTPSCTTDADCGNCQSCSGGVCDFTSASKTMTVTLVPDSYPDEILWRVDGPGVKQESQTNEIFPVCEGESYTITIYDGYGDGLFDPGYYKVEVDGQEYATGGGFYNDQYTCSQNKTFAVTVPARRRLQSTVSLASLNPNLRRALIFEDDSNSNSVKINRASPSEINDRKNNRGLTSIGQMPERLLVVNSLSYQAEDASTLAGTTVETVSSGYSGSGYVKFTGPNSYMEWDNIFAQEFGPCTFDFRYSLGGTDTVRSVYVTVNGQGAGMIHPANTGSWNTWSSISLDTVCAPGNNVVRVTAQANGGPNIDKLTVSGSGNTPENTEPMPFSYPPGATIQWEFEQKLNPLPSQARPGDNFGVSVSMDQDIIIVGAPGDLDGIVTESGSVYVFALGTDGEYTQQHKLLVADSPYAGDRFGMAVATDAESIVIGSFGVDGNEINSFKDGFAYVHSCPTVSYTYSAPIEYQAEEASTFVGTDIKTDNSGYSGFGYVTFRGAGQWLEFNNVQADSTGRCRLDFRYAMGVSSRTRSVYVTINGEGAGIVHFQPTGGWDIWGNMDLSTSCQAGNNIVRLISSSPDGGPAIDSMTVYHSGTSEVPITPTASPTQQAYGPPPEEDAIPGEYIVQMAGIPYEARLAGESFGSRQTALVNTYGGTVLNTWRNSIKGFTISMTQSQANAMEADYRVQHLEPNYKVFSRAVPFFNVIDKNPANWGLERISARGFKSGAYVYIHDAHYVDIFIMDTGINTGHFEFDGRIGNKKTCIGNAGDSANHGTFVASLAAGTTAGPGRKATVHNIQVLDTNGEGNIDSVLCGLEWLANQKSSHSGKRSFKGVVNLAFGTNGKAYTLDNAITGTSNKGIPVVIAAGNDNAKACNYSPYSPKAYMVGAIDDINSNLNPKSSFSNYGSCIDFFAPGSNIQGASASGTLGYTVSGGTSAASAFATGTISLILSRYSMTHNVNVNAVKTELLTKTEDGAVINAGSGSPNRILQTTASVCESDAHCPPGQTCQVDGTCM